MQNASALSHNSQHVHSVAARERKKFLLNTGKETEKTTGFLLQIKALVVAHATNPLLVLELLERSLLLCWPLPSIPLLTVTEINTEFASKLRALKIHFKKHNKNN